MVKRIIFDLDNTLIMWQDKYLFALRNVLEELMPDYTEKQLLDIDNYLVSYEQTHSIYDKEDLVNYINRGCNISLNIEFVDKLILEQGKCYETDDELVSTIKYLKEKYELMILSNWFTETQKLRLKGVGILDCFTLVSGGDERVFKPDPKAFEEVTRGCLKEECLMVGDSLKHDIIPAEKLGIPCIWITNQESNEYRTAKNIYQLKKML